MSKLNRTVSMAPMMDCTDRHDRYFLRLISKHIFLYSEMIATGAILNGDKKKILVDKSKVVVARHKRLKKEQEATKNMVDEYKFMHNVETLEDFRNFVEDELSLILSDNVKKQLLQIIMILNKKIMQEQ